LAHKVSAISTLKEGTVWRELLQLLIDSLGAVLGGAMLLRFWLGYVRVRPPVSVANLIFLLSNWLVMPLRRLLPGRGQDWASLLGAVIVSTLVGALKAFLFWGGFPAKPLVALSLLALLNWLVYGIMGLFVLEVLFSWINPHATLAPAIRAVNAPFLRPFRRWIPPIAGIDFSVMAGFFVLNLIARFLPQLILSSLGG
jgi:YggT family protein